MQRQAEKGFRSPADLSLVILLVNKNYPIMRIQ